MRSVRTDSKLLIHLQRLSLRASFLAPCVHQKLPNSPLFWWCLHSFALVCFIMGTLGNDWFLCIAFAGFVRGIPLLCRASAKSFCGTDKGSGAPEVK